MLDKKIEIYWKRMRNILFVFVIICLIIVVYFAINRHQNRRNFRRKIFKEYNLNYYNSKIERPDTLQAIAKYDSSRNKIVISKYMSEVIEHNGFSFTFEKVTLNKFAILSNDVKTEYKNEDSLDLIRKIPYIRISLKVIVENISDKDNMIENKNTFLITNKEVSKAIILYPESENRFSPNLKRTLYYDFILTKTDVDDIDKIDEITVLLPPKYEVLNNQLKYENGTTLKIKIK